MLDILLVRIRQIQITVMNSDQFLLICSDISALVVDGKSNVYFHYAQSLLIVYGAGLLDLQDINNQHSLCNDVIVSS